jgi:hypothetical protein
MRRTGAAERLGVEFLLRCPGGIGLLETSHNLLGRMVENNGLNSGQQNAWMHGSTRGSVLLCRSDILSCLSGGALRTLLPAMPPMPLL